MPANKPNHRSQREHVEAVALELFETRGFDEVTTVEIAQAAGISPRTFFRYFPTKLDALLGDVHARTDEFAIALHRQPHHLTLVDALVAAIGATTPPPDLVERDLRRGRVMRDTPSLAGALRQYEEHLERRFADWIAQRTRRPVDDFDVQVVAGMFVASRRVVVATWLRSRAEVDIVALARRSLSLLDLHQVEEGREPPPAPPPGPSRGRSVDMSRG